MKMRNHQAETQSTPDQVASRNGRANSLSLAFAVVADYVTLNTSIVHSRPPLVLAAAFSGAHFALALPLDLACSTPAEACDDARDAEAGDRDSAGLGEEGEGENDEPRLMRGLLYEVGRTETGAHKPERDGGDGGDALTSTLRSYLQRYGPGSCRGGWPKRTSVNVYYRPPGPPGASREPRARQIVIVLADEIADGAALSALMRVMHRDPADAGC